MARGRFGLGDVPPPHRRRTVSLGQKAKGRPNGHRLTPWPSGSRHHRFLAFTLRPICRVLSCTPTRAECGGTADSAETATPFRVGKAGAPVRGRDWRKSTDGTRPSAVLRVCSVALAHPAYRRGRTKEPPLRWRGERGTATAVAGWVGFSHYWRLRTKGQMCPFVPIGKGGFSLLVSRPQPPQAGKSLRSFAIFALTPRRKHYILW